MAELWRRQRDLMFLFLLTLSLFGLSSSGGYSCNCDCGPNAGGGRCSLILPSVEYLKSGGTCQAIQLATDTEHCLKNKHQEDETTCWSMPITACMCREPSGNYNLMCECDARGIFCGSEQNNCVCEVLVADKNVALTIGIGVGSAIVGIFVLTFIITIIYFIRKAQKNKDPWYQFDKQFKKFTAYKERQKALGLSRPPREARPFAATHSYPSSHENQVAKVNATIESEPPLPSLYPDPSRSRSRSSSIDIIGSRLELAQTDSNWLLASKTDLTDQLVSSTKVEATKTDELYSTTLPIPNRPKSKKYNRESKSSTLPPTTNRHTESAVIHHAAFINNGHDNGIYESLD